MEITITTDKIVIDGSQNISSNNIIVGGSHNIVTGNNCIIEGYYNIKKEILSKTKIGKILYGQPVELEPSKLSKMERLRKAFRIKIP